MWSKGDMEGSTWRGQAATCDKVVNDKEGIGGIRRIRSQNVNTLGGYSPWYGTN